MSFEKWRRKTLGKSLPISLDDLVDVFDQAKRWLELVEHQTAEGELKDAKDDVRERAARRRARDCDEAVQVGIGLAKVYTCAGPAGWTAHVRDCGMSTRTAFNLLALARLARREPDLYLRLRTLGATKLYRIARLSDEAIRQIYPDVEVELPRGRVKIRQMTDRELETHLQRICPPEKRPVRVGVNRQAHGLPRMLENVPRIEHSPCLSRKELHEICRDTSFWIMDMLDEAV